MATFTRNCLFLRWVDTEGTTTRAFRIRMGGYEPSQKKPAAYARSLRTGKLQTVYAPARPRIIRAPVLIEDDVGAKTANDGESDHAHGTYEELYAAWDADTLYVKNFGDTRYWQCEWRQDHALELTFDPMRNLAVVTLFLEEIDPFRPAHLEFNGTSTYAQCPDETILRNIPTGLLTIDGYIRADGWGGSSAGFVISKIGVVSGDGWQVRIDSSTDGMYAKVDCETLEARSASGLDEFDADSLWHHFLWCYDHTGAVLPAAKTLYGALDGEWFDSYFFQQQGQGDYVGDADLDVFVGQASSGSLFWDGAMGWLRVSSTIRQDPAGGDFTAPERCVIPAIDDYTAGQWIKEGVGDSIYNQVTNVQAPVYDGTWVCDC